jgi:hypothetical protein
VSDNESVEADGELACRSENGGVTEQAVGRKRGAALKRDTATVCESTAASGELEALAADALAFSNLPVIIEQATAIDPGSSVVSVT